MLIDHRFSCATSSCLYPLHTSPFGNICLLLVRNSSSLFSGNEDASPKSIASTLMSFIIPFYPVSLLNTIIFLSGFLILL